MDLVSCTTRMPGTSNTSVIGVRHEGHKCDMRATRVTRVQHECDTNAARATQV